MTARVLVVDDIPINVKLLEVRLTNENFDVATAFSGQEALDKLDASIPDIVLLDVMMPGMDGYEVCRRIRQNPRTARLPVVMVTALDRAIDRDTGLAAGANDFLVKPVDDELLLRRIRALTNRNAAAA